MLPYFIHTPLKEESKTKLILIEQYNSAIENVKVIKNMLNKVDDLNMSTDDKNKYRQRLETYLASINSKIKSASVTSFKVA